jgi:Putative auto-transporter adhesin, head GIN domain
MLMMQTTELDEETIMKNAPALKHSQRAVSAAGAILASALIFAAACAPALAADKDKSNGWNWSFSWDGNVMKGSGKPITDKRAITGFDSLSLKGSFDVTLAQGANEGVEITGDDNIVPLIETRVDGTKLVVTTKKGTSFSTRNPILITVQAKNLNAIAVSGSGDVKANGLKADALGVSISGSGNVKLDGLQSTSLGVVISGSGDFSASGKATTQIISISGSGDVRTEKLEGTDVTVKIAGSGDAQVWAKNTLTASIAGSGDITYVGDAKVTQSVAGSGSVSRK